MPIILVVDDDRVDQELVARCLKSLDDVELLYASHAQQAIESIAVRSPDIVLTDLRMPGMDGLELVEHLQQEQPGLPVILMTSQGNERIAVQALKAGALSYVPKSAMKTDLTDTVLDVLKIAEARRMRRTLFGYLQHCEVRFELENDPGLVFPVAAYFEDHLGLRGFGNPTVCGQIGIALAEALTNAMIHGNLEVDSELRTTAHAEYRDLIRRRRAEEPYASRRVRCSARETTDSIEYTIEDQGDGFDVTTLPDPTAPENLLNVSGRGLLLIRTYMDQVAFNDRGNRITMKKTCPLGDGAPAGVKT